MNSLRPDSGQKSGCVRGSDFPDEIDSGLQGLCSGLPLGWADFARMGRYELGSLNFSEQLVRTPSDSVVVNFGDFDPAFWINHESSPIGDSLPIFLKSS